MRRLFIGLLCVSLWLPTPVDAAIGGGVSLGHTVQSSSTTNVITTATNDCPVGSLIVLAASYTTIANPLSSVADSGGNSWSTPQDTITVTGVGIAFAYATNTAFDLPTGGTITATFGGSTTSATAAACIPRAAKNNALDARNNSASGTSGTSSITVTSPTLASADENVLCLLANSVALGSNSATGYSALVSSGSTTPNILIYRMTVTANAAVSCAPTWTNSGSYVTDLISFAGLWGGNLSTLGAGAH